MISKVIILTCTVLLFGIANNASAFRLINGAHVTMLQGTQVPSNVVFMLDNPSNTACSGNWIYYDGTAPSIPAAIDKTANIKAVWTLLLAAKLSGQPINVYLDDNSCNVLDIYIVQQ